MKSGRSINMPDKTVTLTSNVNDIPQFDDLPDHVLAELSKKELFAECVRLRKQRALRPAHETGALLCRYCPARFMTAWEHEVHEKEHAPKAREPRMVECGYCHGDGRLRFSGDMHACEKCGGTGQVKEAEAQ
jgi:hypothetical protein